LHIVATYPADGQGTNTGTDAGVACDTPTPDCALPTDLEIELRFDRFLLPVANFEADIQLFTGGRFYPIAASYDLIERVVVLHPGSLLNPNTLYTVEIKPPSNPNQGLWAFDRAPLEAGPVPLRFSFTTGSGQAAPAKPAVVTSDNCQTLTAGPLNVCASCHVTPPAVPPTDPEEWAKAYPPMGLTLTDWGLKHTAISYVAHETATGDSALGPGLDSTPRFGVQMNIVQGESPENSYLMYKLLMRPESYGQHEDCPLAFHPPVADGTCVAPSADELTRLAEWFVRGDPMPKDIGKPSPLSRADLERVSTWIAQNAICDVP
jgi:hypothetical protein